MATTIPRAQRRANEQAARAVKPIWYAQAGLRPGSVVAGRKVSIGDSTRGFDTITTLLSWRGAVHLIEGGAQRHIIGARLLGTRGAIRGKTARLGAGSAFGGSNRGVFGRFKENVNYNQYGSVRQQSAKGTTRRRSGKRALTIGPNLRAYAFHPGMKGRRFWRKNVDSAQKITTTVYRQAALPSMLREAGFG